jgi:NADH-quinone oxidoreductase subunit C
MNDSALSAAIYLKSLLTQVLTKVAPLLITVAHEEVTLDVPHQSYRWVMQELCDHPQLKFEQLIDLCGVDYQDYGSGPWTRQRFAVVVHLLSVTYNRRLRIKVFCPDDELPIVPSVSDIWSRFVRNCF